MIFSIKDSNGNVLNDVDQINKEAISFYSDIFVDKFDELMIDLNMLDVIPISILEAQNAMLMEEVCIREFKKALFDMGGDKALGPDGFPTIFFQKLWDIFAHDLW